MVIITIVNYSNFAYMNKNSIYNGLTEVIAERPENITNKQLVADIEDICQKLGTDVMYSTSGDNGTSRLFYKTNNLDNFLNIKLDGNTQKLKSGECFSTLDSVDKHNVKALYMSVLFGNSTIYPFEECIEYNLATAGFCVTTEAYDDFIFELESRGYTTYLNENPLTLGDTLYNMTDYITSLFIIFVISLFIYFIHNGKEHVLKKLEGYSSANIIIEKIGEFIVGFLVIFIIIEIVNLIVFSIFNNRLLTDYIIYTIHSPMTMCLGLVVIALFLSSLSVIFHNNNIFIKGKRNKNTVLYLTAVAKVAVIIFICTPFIVSIKILPSVISNYHNAKVVEEKTQNYVVPNIYGWRSEDINEKLRNFYNLAVDEYNGIFMDGTSWHNNYDVEKIDVEKYRDRLQVPKGLTLEEFIYINLYYININANYLNLNPIHKPDGTLITDDDFDNNKLNIMVSENEKHINAVITNFKSLYKEIMENEFPGEVLEFNIIYYKDGEEFCLLNSGYNNSVSYAKNPIVYIEEGMLHKLESDNVISFFDNNRFILETYTNDPYNEILPLIKKCGLEGVILNTSTTSEGFQRAMSINMEALMEYGIQTVMCLILYIFISVFYVKTYLQNYKDDIAIRKLSGESFFVLHKRFFTISLIALVVTLVGLVIVLPQNLSDFSGVELWIPMVVFIFEAIIFKIYSGVFTRKGILKTLKGDCL